jgi:RNA polymerase sigma-70 factor, ECF subfamily
MSSDQETFHEVVREHQGRIYHLALAMTGNRSDAEDIVQEAFLRAYQSRASFRGDSAIGTWLYRITANLSLDALSRRQRDRARSAADDPPQVPGIEAEARSNDDPERMAGSSITGREIDKALASLTPRERAVFVLRHYEDLPIKAVASTLSIRIGTVKSLLFRAVTKLQRELSHYREEVDG